MKSTLGHLQLNVADAGRSVPFYRELLAYLEYRVLLETRDVLGMSDGATAVWIIQIPAERRAAVFHRKNIGLNHVAFRVATREDVDRFAREFLVPRSIAALYGGARDYPEYRKGYYAVFFEDPDRLKLEVAFIP